MQIERACESLDRDEDQFNQGTFPKASERGGRAGGGKCHEVKIILYLCRQGSTPQWQWVVLIFPSKFVPEFFRTQSRAAPLAFFPCREAHKRHSEEDAIFAIFPICNHPYDRTTKHKYGAQPRIFTVISYSQAVV
jgi:hypothetical protein